MNPKGPKRSITIRLDLETIGYFSELSYETGVPYQTLINLYLRQCADLRKPLAWTSYSTSWQAKGRRRASGGS